MVAWFTVVVEANQFPCYFLIQELGKEEEPTRKLPLLLFYNQGNHSVDKTFFSVCTSLRENSASGVLS